MRMENGDVAERGGEDLTAYSPHAGPAATLSRAVALLFAVMCGLAVANVYYAQPLLDRMAGEFGISHATIGLVITITQIGYGLGLLLVVPLGDFLDRRRLILGQSLLSVLALLAVAAAPSGTVLLVGMGAVGLLAVVTQVLVAYAAALARPAERGPCPGISRRTGQYDRSSGPTGCPGSSLASVSPIRHAFRLRTGAVRGECR